MPRFAATLLAAASLAAVAPAAHASRPNIILIVADDLGYGDLGCYGQKQIQTPNLDRLAAESTRFTQFYAGSTVCAPSRCCLMSGLHTGHATVRGNKTVPLRPEDVTIAEICQRAGYTTAIFGKWGLGEPGSTGVPNRQGFDAWFGYLNQVHAHNYYPDFLWENETKAFLPGNADGKKEQYTHDLFTERALDFIRTPHDRPFLLYLPYTIPHANNELGRESGNGMEVPTDEPYSDQDWPQPQKNHAAMITRLDRDIGRIMQALADRRLADDTIVLFTSDNGPHAEGGADPEFFDANGPLRGLKRDLYEGGIRVPMIVRWPGRTPAGAVSPHVWAMWDLLPTIARMVGVRGLDGLDGVSMLPALLGLPADAHEYLYWEFHERGFHQAVRTGDFKAVRHDRGKIELYNLAADLGERKDVAADHPDAVKKIEGYFNSARTDSTEWPLK